VHGLAIRSAALKGGFERVVLHHDSALSRLPLWEELVATRGVEARLLEPEALFAHCGEHAHAVSRLFAALDKPEARANVLRAALLDTHGGVYLDTDTVTIADLSPLRSQGGAFCGQERVVKPAHWERDRSLGGRLSLLLRARARDALKHIPHGYRAFRRLEALYPLAVNNAVLASEPGHPLLAEMLARMGAAPAQLRNLRYGLGTHMLQDAVRDYRGTDLQVLGPGVFYPLGPEISRHWFRSSRAPDLGSVLRPETKVVHWYASVRTKRIAQQIDADYVRRHASSQLFCQLALPFVNQPS
jgi:hypothetical protein